MVARELIHVVGFQMNEASYASIENRVSRLGRMMTFATTVPAVLLGKSFLEASYKADMLANSIAVYAENAGQAAQVTAELRKIAREMPTVKLEDMSEMVGPLLTRGVAIKDLAQTFKTFAVITGATGGSMKGVTKAFTDMMNKGVLQGQEFNQFINANVPLMQALAKSTGKTVKELNAMRKAGRGITYDMVNKAMAELAKEGGKFSNMLDNIANMLYGRWQKMLDTLFSLEGQLGKKLEVPLKVLVGLVDNLLNSLTKIDPNHYRFAIIALGVMAITGPLMGLVTLFMMFGSVISVAAAAMAILSLAVDDVYVWINGGKSVLGVMFGDYELYRPKILELKGILLDMFGQLKGLVKDVALDLVNLMGLFSTKNKDFTALTAVLEIFKQLLSLVDSAIISIRILAALLTSPFMSDEQFSKTKERIVNAALKSNTFAGDMARAGVSAGEWLNKNSPKLTNFLFGDVGSAGQARDAMSRWNNVQSAYRMGVDPYANFLPRSQQQGGGAVGPRIDIGEVKIDARNTGHSQAALTKAVKDGVHTAIQQAADTLNANFSGVPAPAVGQ